MSETEPGPPGENKQITERHYYSLQSSVTLQYYRVTSRLTALFCATGQGPPSRSYLSVFLLFWISGPKIEKFCEND